MLDLEQSNIQRVLSEKGKDAPVVAKDEVAQTVERIAAGQGKRLNEGQRAAVEKILASEDRIIGLQGGAGTGKTTALATIREAAERAGYQVQGFAPTTRAAALLAEGGIQTKTLQRFLHEPEMASDNLTRMLYVLDESSLASTRNIHRFFERVGPRDKVLLVGDTRQHQAVEAGSPFEQLQRRGMETARLTEIVRQRDPKLKRAVERLSAKEVKEAVRELQSQGRVIEIADEKERLQAIAADYCRRPENTLVISPANRERVALNATIHRGLQQQGLVSREERRAGVYVNRQDMTGTERTFALSYAPGEDVIRYGRKSKVHGISAGDYAKVLATDHGQNTVTVRLRDGRELTYNPARLQGVSVYKEGERSFAEGDRVQFRAPFPEQRVANGELGRLEKIEGAQFTVSLDGGRRVSFDSTRFRHLDHGYAVTSYSSQGQTVDRVIVNADTKESEVLLNRRMGYVAVSRAREDAIIYTNSQEELGAALDRAVDKEMGLETVQQAARSDPHAGMHDVAKPLDRNAEINTNSHSIGVSW